MNTITFSHKGKRANNEDYVLVQKINDETEIFIVSDGMGGYEYGDKAAKLVAENILAYLSTIIKITPTEIQVAINKANLAIKQLSKDKGETIGATVGGLISREEYGISFWVGDVQIFHFRNRKLHFESSPHTLINKLKKNNSLNNIESYSKYKHVVTRSVQGDLSHSKIDYHEVDLEEDDLIIICSDGVHDILNGFEMERIFKNNNTIKEFSRSIEAVCLNQSLDNFTAILVQLD